MAKDKKDYIAFDKFITTKIKDGTLHIDMTEHGLKEILRQLGLHRVRDKESGYVLNQYPTKPQIEHVKGLMDTKAVQQKIDKSMFFSREKQGKGNRYRAREIIFYNNKIYKRGMFIPKKYSEE